MAARGNYHRGPGEAGSAAQQHSAPPPQFPAALCLCLALWVQGPGPPATRGVAAGLRLRWGPAAFARQAWPLGQPVVSALPVSCQPGHAAFLGRCSRAAAPSLPPLSPAHVLLLAREACALWLLLTASSRGVSALPRSVRLLWALPERTWSGHFWHLVLAGQSSVPGHLAGLWGRPDQPVSGSLGVSCQAPELLVIRGQLLGDMSQSVAASG